VRKSEVEDEGIKESAPYGVNIFTGFQFGGGVVGQSLGEDIGHEEGVCGETNIESTGGYFGQREGEDFIVAEDRGDGIPDGGVVPKENDANAFVGGHVSEIEEEGERMVGGMAIFAAELVFSGIAYVIRELFRGGEFNGVIGIIYGDGYGLFGRKFEPVGEGILVVIPFDEREGSGDGGDGGDGGNVSKWA
jgi:hypothetical protein